MPLNFNLFSRSSPHRDESGSYPKIEPESEPTEILQAHQQPHKHESGSDSELESISDPKELQAVVETVRRETFRRPRSSEIRIRLLNSVRHDGREDEPNDTSDSENSFHTTKVERSLSEDKTLYTQDCTDFESPALLPNDKSLRKATSNHNNPFTRNHQVRRASATSLPSALNQVGTSLEKTTSQRSRCTNRDSGNENAPEEITSAEQGFPSTKKEIIQRYTNKHYTILYPKSSPTSERSDKVNEYNANAALDWAVKHIIEESEGTYMIRDYQILKILNDEERKRGNANIQRKDKEQSFGEWVYFDGKTLQTNDRSENNEGLKVDDGFKEVDLNESFDGNFRGSVWHKTHLELPKNPKPIRDDFDLEAQKSSSSTPYEFEYELLPIDWAQWLSDWQKLCPTIMQCIEGEIEWSRFGAELNLTEEEWRENRIFFELWGRELKRLVGGLWGRLFG